MKRCKHKHKSGRDAWWYIGHAGHHYHYWCPICGALRRTQTVFVQPESKTTDRTQSPRREIERLKASREADETPRSLLSGITVRRNWSG